MHRNHILPLLLLLFFMFSCKVPKEKKVPVEGLSRTETLRLLPDNPRYLEYKGEPVILITSAEHYGAVLNLDFDYQVYLETLAKEGFNYTRIFTGSYIEPVENIFGIQGNTLAPLPGRYLAPWVMKDGKYDLDQFSSDFFERLKDFVSTAEEQGIIVEITLFTSIYAESAWELSPFNARNNINGVGDLPFQRVNTLYNGELLEYQQKYIQKIVSELNDFNNVFFEIQNEPWSDNQNLAGFVNEEDNEVFIQPWQKQVVIANALSMDWQAWVVSVIMEKEAALTKSHLIAQNICNFEFDLDSMPQGVSMVNFHYALPGAVQMNLGLGGVIGLDETGFMPHDEQLYLDQAWRVILSGGGLYNNLDYSFTVGNEQGNWPIPDGNPGWGGPQFRKKLSVLVETMKLVPYWDMDFSGDLIASDAPGMKQCGLHKNNELCLVFLENAGSQEMVPQLEHGEYEVTYINVDTGEQNMEILKLGNGKVLRSPVKGSRIALMFRKSD